MYNINLILQPLRWFSGKRIHDKGGSPTYCGLDRRVDAYMTTMSNTTNTWFRSGYILNELLKVDCLWVRGRHWLIGKLMKSIKIQKIVKHEQTKRVWGDRQTRPRPSIIRHYINLLCIHVQPATRHLASTYVVWDRLKWMVVFDFGIYLPGVQTRDGTTQSARHWSHK